MFDIKNVDIVVSTRYLVKNLNLTLNKGDKCAIIGEEGNGKSTILKSFLGICEYARLSGCVNFKGNRVGYLKQNLRDTENVSVRDYLFLTDDAFYEEIGYFYKLLDELFIDDVILEQNIETLSGGELVKVSLLKVLLTHPDILFLDEPTNDLDIAALEWLEGFITKTSMPILFVSHDETLLSKTANMILHIEQWKKKTDCRHTLFYGNYNDYVDMRLKDIDTQTRVARTERREAKKREEKLNRIMQSVEYKQNTISRQDPHGAKVLKVKMRALKAQEERYKKEEFTEIPDPEESIYFKFNENFIPKNKEILNLNIAELSVAKKVLSKNIVLSIKGCEHVCITGKNGVGKSTLIKLIYDELKSRDDIVLGYMPQNYQDVLKNFLTPLDFLASSSIEDKTEARKYLGNMKFTREEMVGNIKNLSNGSIAKLFFTKFVRNNCNVLLLDEPTRNVSPLSNPVIREVMREFKGTIICVTHDRMFIDRVATSWYDLKEDGLKKIK